MDGRESSSGSRTRGSECRKRFSIRSSTRSSPRRRTVPASVSRSVAASSSDTRDTSGSPPSRGAARRSACGCRASNVMANETVLLVDDKANNLEVLRALLAEERYEVRVARSGEAALADVLAAVPDVIVTDLKMPEMDGLEFFHAVRAIDGDVPAIFI